MDCLKNSKIILETERLILRELVPDDFSSLCLILQDGKAMYAYEHAFDDTEVREWLDKQLLRYRKDGFGLWAVILRETNEFIGQCGITLQPCGDSLVHEVGYLLRRSFWHRGHASEAALACKAHAFDSLGISELYTIIRDSNLASRRVALHLGMKKKGQLIKHYHGVTMPHDIFSVRRNNASPV